MKYLAPLLTLCLLLAFFVAPKAENKKVTDRTASPAWTTVVKPAIESLTSDTNYQDDDDLFFAVEANAEYEWIADLIVDTHSTPDFKSQWTGPASPAYVTYTHYLCGDGTLRKAAVEATAFSTSTNNASTAANSAFKMRGYLRNGVNSGTVRLQWAQNSSGVVATSVLPGSTLMWRRVKYTTIDGEPKLITTTGTENKPWNYVYKSIDESITNNTYQDDDHLSFAVSANKIYQWEMTLYVTIIAAADFKYQFTGPTSPTTVRYWSETTQNTTGAGFIALGTMSTAFSTTKSAANIDAPFVGTFGGYPSNGANAGTVQLQWAQITTDPTATTVHKWSMLRWRELN